MNNKTPAAGIALGILLTLPVATLLPGAHAAGTDEIIVTVRRKEETLQEVPLSVLAISEQEIQNRGIVNFENIATLDPSVIVDNGFSAEDIKIAVRGLSNTRGRSSVAFLVDGVDITSEAVGTGGSSLLTNQRLLNDIERIEIVKGPQSALYGRAAFAGAISYITKAANLEMMEGNTGFEWADNNEYQVSSGISGPLIANKLGLGFQAVVWEGDSFYDNAASGRNFGGSDGWGVSANLNFEPSDAVSVRWRTNYSDDTRGAWPHIAYIGDDRIEVPIPEAAKMSNGGPVPDDTDARFRAPTLGKAAGRLPVASEDPVTNDEYVASQLELFRSSLNVNWDVGGGTFTSITGVTKAESRITQDVDYQARGFPDQLRNNFEADSLNHTTQLSQEFRYLSNFESALNYGVGVLGWRERKDVLLREYLVTCKFDFEPICANGNWQDLIRAVDLQYGDGGFSDSKTKHISLYGLVDWQATDKLNVNLEARAVSENFELSRTLGALCVLAIFDDPPCFPAEDNMGAGSVRSSFLVPKLTVKYAASDTVLFYASAGKGQKPAGISTVQSGGGQGIDELKFEPEKMWAFETGWKTEFDTNAGRFVFNGAVFFQDYTDKQVVKTNFDPQLGAVPSIENASAAEVFGQEFQLIYMPPVDGLTFSVAYTHLNAEYTDYVATSELELDIIEAGNCTIVLVSAENPNDPDETRPICEIDRSGNKLEKAPEHALVAAARVLRPLPYSGWEYLFELDAQFQGERFASNNNFTIAEDVWLTHLRVGVQSDRWSIIGFVNNVFDDDTITSGGEESPDFGEAFAIPPRLITTSQLPNPRQIGIRINRKFGG